MAARYRNATLSLKKIVIDCRELQGGMTGIGRFLHNFLISLGSLDRENKYFLLFNKKTELNIRCDNITSHIIPESSTFLWDQWILPRYLRAIKADVFFSTYYKAPLLASCPTIITIHDVYFFTLPIHRKQNGFLLNLYYRFAGRVFCRKATEILTVSEHSKQEIMRAYGVPSEKIKIVYNGVDLDRFQRLPTEEVKNRIQSKFPKIHGNYILYVGNSKPHKNISFLVKGYDSLPEDFKKTTQIVLAGVGENFCRETTDGTDRLVLIPFVDEADLPLIYNAATVFATASLDEGFCLPVVEAMACGTPVLVSNRGAIPEIVSQGGYFFNPDNEADFVCKLTSLLRDPLMREASSTKGINEARRFSIQSYSEKIYRILMHAVNAM